MTRYLTNNEPLLAELTTWGFDGVISRRFFSSPNTYREQWSNLVDGARCSRISVATGRSIHRIREEFDTGVKIVASPVVSEQIASLGGNQLGRAIRYLGFEVDRVWLDSIVQGFSGLFVFKATVPDQTGGRQGRWLLKVGRSLTKLDREVKAHRAMFLSGLKRNLAVPLLHSAIVSSSGVGCIAYAFEEGAATALDELLSEEGRAEEVWERLSEALSELFRGSAEGPCIPRMAFSAKSLGHVPGKENVDPILAHLAAGTPMPLLDTTIIVLAGPQHGDLHLRNILLGAAGPVFIDFAHYRGAADGGLPAVDCAKLLTDAWAFTDGVKIRELLDGEILDRLDLNRVMGGGREVREEILANQRLLFSIATRYFLGLYATYDDVPADRRAEACRELGLV